MLPLFAAAASQTAILAGPGYVVGWGTLSLINAGLAQSKGRGGLAWFLISLLLGPIATLLIVVLRRVEPPAASKHLAL